jgi:NAD(P)-dependent dehydrogenase (short-subunit alcohol dehydrogenase family)
MNALDRFNLKEKIIVLTGGTSRYGRGLTADLASAGATLVIASRNADACQRVADEECRNGRDVHAETYDQGEESSIVQLREKVLGRFGRIDGLVNNSVAKSMSSPMGSLAEWEASMRVNATGLMLMHRIFGETFCRQGHGSIVNIGSIHGMGGPTLSLYVGTQKPIPQPDYFFHKGGMLNLTRYYAATFGKSGVRVNCLSPGGFMFQDTEPFLGRYNEKTFLGRLGNETDLGGPVIFFLSDASAYLTGVNLPVDGGYTAH